MMVISKFVSLVSTYCASFRTMLIYLVLSLIVLQGDWQVQDRLVWNFCTGEDFPQMKSLLKIDQFHL